MFSLLAILAPMAFLEALISPVLFAGVTWALGGKHPYRTALLLLSGFLAVLWLAGYALAPVFVAVRERFTNPEGADYVIGMGIGALLVLAAVLHGRRPKARVYKVMPLSAPGAVLRGVQVGLLGTPFALPYFAALDVITRSGVPGAAAQVAVFFFLGVFSLPFLGLVLARRLLHEESKIFFERVNRGVGSASQLLVPLLLFALGAVLLADGVGWMLGRPILPTGSD